MSRYLDPADLLDLPEPEPVVLMGVAVDLDPWYEATRNPLRLTLADLEAAGWESDPTEAELYHREHGSCGFYVATQIEASRVGLCENPKHLDNASF